MGNNKVRVRESLALALTIALIAGAVIALIGIATATITQAGGPVGPRCPTPCPLDIAFVLDASESMNDEVGAGVTKLDVLKDAMHVFINTTCPDGLWYIGIVTFNTTVSWPLYIPTIHNITGDIIKNVDSDSVKAFLNDSVDSITAGGCTPLGHGIYNGTALLATGRDDAPDMMIIVSDGIPNIPGACEETGNPVAMEFAKNAADEARSQNITIVVVFTGDPSGDYDEWLRDNIADVFINASLQAGTDLEQVFLELTEDVCQYVCSVGLDKLGKLVTPFETAYRDETSAPPGAKVGHILNTTLAAGEIDNMTIVDELPEGLTFTGETPKVINGTGVDYAAYIYAWFPGNRTLRFYFDNITVSGVSESFIAIEYNVTVLNTTSRGDLLVNNASVKAMTNTSSCTSQDTTTVKVIEPELAVDKKASTNVIGPENPYVDFLVNVTNKDVPNASTAFDVSIVDSVSPELVVYSVTWTSHLANGIHNQTSGNNVKVLVDELYAGGWIALTIKTRLSSTSYINVTIDNEAMYVGSSMPGDVPDEKTYSGGALASVEYQGNLSMYKEVRRLTPTQTDFLDDVDVAPGSKVEFIVNATVPLGTIRELNITDDLPPGLSLISGEVSVSYGPCVTASSETKTITGNSLLIELGGLTNACEGYSWVAALFNATVDTGATPGDVIVNTGYVTWVDGSGYTYSLDDNATLRVKGLELEIDKVINPSTVSTDSPIFNITVELRNNGIATAYNVNVTDDLMGYFEVVNAVITEESGASGASVSVIDGRIVLITADSLGPGGYIRANITASVHGGTPYDIVFNNTACYNASTSETDGTVYEDCDNDTITYNTSFNVAKLVRNVWPFTTSFAPSTTAAPGALVEYLVNVTVPMGRTDNLTITDEVPAGIDIDLSTLTITTGPGVSYSTETHSLVGGVLKVVISDLENDHSTYSWIAMAYKGRVSTSTNRGDGLANNVTVYYEDYEGNTEEAGNDETIIEVIEPDIKVTKVLEDSGHFIVKVENPADFPQCEWPLYNVTIDDNVPPELTVCGVEVVNSSGVNGLHNLTGDNHVYFTIDMLDVKGYITLRICFRPNSLTPWGGTIVNVARANGSSVPIPYGKTYQDEDDASITYSVSIDAAKYVKTETPDEVASGWDTESEAVPGSSIRYLVNATLPAGSTDMVKFEDILSTYLAAPAPGDVSVLKSSSVSYDLATVLVDGSNVTVVLENVSVSSSGGWVAIEIPAVVLNTAYDGLEIPDVATVTWLANGGEESVQTNYANITVKEPSLSIVKEASPETVSEASPNAVLTITVSNSGDVSAYDLDIVDDVPVELEVLGVSVADQSGVVGLTNLTSGNHVHFLIDRMLPGGYITLEVSVRVDTSLVTCTPTTITNVASYNASSMPGAVEYEKVYEGEDDASITYCAPLEVVKKVRTVEPYVTEYGDSTTAPPGGLVEVLINVTLPCEDLGTLTIASSIPEGLAVEGDVQVELGPDASADSVDISNNGTHVIVTLTNARVPYAPSSYVLVKYNESVGTSLSDGDVLTNVATATYSNPPCYGEGSDMASVFVREPHVYVSKVADKWEVDTGEVVVFTITVRNVGVLAMYNLVIHDDMPAGLYITNVEGLNASLSITWDNTWFTATAPLLNPGEVLVIKVTTLVAAYGTTVLNNVVHVTSDSVPEPPAKTYDAYDNEILIVNPPVGGKAFMEVWEANTNILIATASLAVAIALLVIAYLLRRRH